MPKRLILNGFSMNAVSHVFHGFWRRPDTRQTEFNDLDAWIELAQLLERGKFDALFVADILGVDASYKESWDTYLKEAVQVPINDSGVLAATLVAATEHLGLTFTSSILQEHPFNFARKVSTLDHLSKGRVGWNIVTSVSHNAAQNFGFDRIVPHDERYRWAEEYVDVLYKLWEGSWEDDAVLADKAAGVYADPAKVHRIHHAGERYKVLGPHLAQPSRQRTPVLFQAGSSHAGRRFAARHAEGTFITALNPVGVRKVTADIRAQVAAAGRDPSDLLFIQGLSFVIGGTEEEARRKARDLDEYRSDDGLLAHISRDLGVDLGFSNEIARSTISRSRGCKAWSGSSRRPTLAGARRSRTSAQPMPITPASWARRRASWTRLRNGRKRVSTASTSSTRPPPARLSSSSTRSFPCCGSAGSRRRNTRLARCASACSPVGRPS